MEKNNLPATHYVKHKTTLQYHIRYTVEGFIDLNYKYTQEPLHMNTF